MIPIWPPVPTDVNGVHGMADVEVFQSQDEKGKPVLKLTFGLTVIYVTANTVEMIGGVAIGARKRWEDFHSEETRAGKVQ